MESGGCAAKCGVPAAAEMPFSPWHVEHTWALALPAMASGAAHTCADKKLMKKKAIP